MFIALPPTLENVDISNSRQSYQTEVTRLQLIHELFVEHQKRLEDDKNRHSYKNLVLNRKFDIGS